MSYPPIILITLKETPTTFLFELPSLVCEKGTDKASEIEKENEYYEYMTQGKGKNRKTVSKETQTNDSTYQTKHTAATLPENINVMSFASTWDIHDTYLKLSIENTEKETDEMVLFETINENVRRKNRKTIKIREQNTNGDSLQNLMKSANLLNKIMITGRVLHSNMYQNEQKTLRGLDPYDPLSLNLVFTYTLNKLWVYECKNTQKRAVSAFRFSPKNFQILAVAYGKFYYEDNIDGLICIWCAKNPCDPERAYSFESPATSLSFSEKNPHWLACGFENGDVVILDITSHEKKILAQSSRSTSPSYEPIWTTNWANGDYCSEYVITTCQDGRVNRFRKMSTNYFECRLMNRLKCEEKNIGVSVTLYPAALCFCWNPNEELCSRQYFIGTDEGYIHKCSVNFLNKSIGVFKAHTGPVYKVIFSPFQKSNLRLLVSCGADNKIQFWLDDIDDSVMTLHCSAPVMDVALSPIHSTVILSVSRNVLSIWDIRRKNHEPCAQYTFDKEVVLTSVTFSPEGENIFVGDTSGKIHVFRLTDMPIPSYNQEDLLYDTIKNYLSIKPLILEAICRRES